MRPQAIGRVLGIGLRVAGRVAGERIAANTQSPATPRPTLNAVDRGRVAGQASRGVAQGIGGFLRPFRRIGGILWLEVTGVFFLLPVVVFTPFLWRTRASYLHGPDHRTFVVTAVIVVVFLYLGVTSFWRARKR